ncbi:MAG TPA: heavy-metal-associated domain-containing protein [Sphingomicrobium sp.]|nr:heavy-metal-associated domain-containing protein [Sphingomicrobium sp.]
MLRPPFVALLLLIAAAAGVSGILYAQLETGDRGILPLDSSGTLEITGIHVDVSAENAESARFAGWRVAQRQGFKALWAKMHSAPPERAPNLPDSTLDDIVSSITVQREEIGPKRYIAELGILFDGARAAPYLGVEGGQVKRSRPMLLIPILVSGGTATSVELRNVWQRAWAEFRTSQSPIDYVRVSGMGSDPLLINAAQTARPGRGWWRTLIDMYGASDILVAEVQLQRLYPGGPARARFIGRHGPDNRIVGGFTLTAANGEAIPAMMARGAQQMDQLFTRAFEAGQLARDPSLNLPPPPVVLEEPKETGPRADQPMQAATNSFQVQVTGGDVTVYNFAMAHLRTLGGIESATPQQINPAGTSYILVTFRGDIAQLAAALSGRGWVVEHSGTVVRIRSSSDRPPAIPPPPQPAPTPTPVPAPTQPPQAATNESTGRPQ